MQFSLFAAGPDRVQLHGRNLPPHAVAVSVGDQIQRFDGDRRSVVFTVDGLGPNKATPNRPATHSAGSHRAGSNRAGSNSAGPELLPVQVSGGPADHPETVTTLPAARGAHLGRVATASDLHIGAYRWGFFKTMRPAGPPADDLDGAGYASVAAFDALADIAAWDPALVVLKGDLAQHRRDHDFEVLGSILDRFEQLPMTLVPGNHDVDRHSQIDVPRTVGALQRPLVMGIKVNDLPGLRVISANSTVDGADRGTLVRVGHDILDAASDAARDGVATMICLHHQLQLERVPRGWPPGISRAESVAFLDRLIAANSSSLVTSGHVHRNRRLRYGPITITEVAATRDWPGVWAAYDIYEGGITQATYRISAPRTVQWHDYSRQAVGGVWGRWSPGRFGDRCMTLNW